MIVIGYEPIMHSELIRTASAVFSQSRLPSTLRTIHTFTYKLLIRKNIKKIKKDAQADIKYIFTLCFLNEEELNGFM